MTFAFSFDAAISDWQSGLHYITKLIPFFIEDQKYLPTYP